MNFWFLSSILRIHKLNIVWCAGRFIKTKKTGTSTHAQELIICVSSLGCFYLQCQCKYIEAASSGNASSADVSLTVGVRDAMLSDTSNSLSSMQHPTPFQGRYQHIHTQAKQNNKQQGRHETEQMKQNDQKMKGLEYEERNSKEISFILGIKLHFSRNPKQLLKDDFLYSYILLYQWHKCCCCMKRTEQTCLLMTIILLFTAMSVLCHVKQHN